MNWNTYCKLGRTIFRKKRISGSENPIFTKCCMDLYGNNMFGLNLFLNNKIGKRLILLDYQCDHAQTDLLFSHYKTHILEVVCISVAGATKKMQNKRDI